MLLINNINANIVEPMNTNIKLNNNVVFSIHDTTCNHISTYGLEAFVLNLKNVIGSFEIETSSNYGLLVNNNKDFLDLRVSYE